VASRTGLPARTAREAISRLEALGLASRDGKKRVWATSAGRSEAGAGVPGVQLTPALAEAIACFPTEAHRACARLLLSGIVARHHLGERHTDGWGGFIVLGPTQTAKTSLATFACRVFGVDPLRAVTLAPDETPGSLFVRRTQSKDGWKVQVSPRLQLPFLCLDEWDKADEEVRREAGKLLLGHTVLELEGSR